jgi:hypothetical protein
MDIRFSCPACGHHMVIDEAGAGLVVQCTECGHDANVPKAVGSKPAVGAPPQNEPTVALKWVPPPADPPPKK